MDKIISKFIKEEEENYALFNYVNELSHEIEQLNETVQQLQDSIGNCSKLHLNLIKKPSSSFRSIKSCNFNLLFADEHKDLQEQKKNSQDDNMDVLKEESQIQRQFADDANNFKDECEARLQETLRAVEKLYK